MPVYKSDAETAGMDCAAQQAWGKCDAIWMREGDFCRKTCDRCYTGCTSLPLAANCSTSPGAVPCGPVSGWLLAAGFAPGADALALPTVRRPLAAKGCTRAAPPGPASPGP